MAELVKKHRKRRIIIINNQDRYVLNNFSDRLVP